RTTNVALILKLLLEGNLFFQVGQYLPVEGRFLNHIVVGPEFLVVRPVLILKPIVFHLFRGGDPLLGVWRDLIDEQLLVEFSFKIQLLGTTIIPVDAGGNGHVVDIHLPLVLSEVDGLLKSVEGTVHPFPAGDDLAGGAGFRFEVDDRVVAFIDIHLQVKVFLMGDDKDWMSIVVSVSFLFYSFESVIVVFELPIPDVVLQKKVFKAVILIEVLRDLVLLPTPLPYFNKLDALAETEAVTRFTIVVIIDSNGRFQQGNVRSPYLLCVAVEPIKKERLHRVVFFNAGKGDAQYIATR